LNKRQNATENFDQDVQIQSEFKKKKPELNQGAQQIKETSKVAGETQVSASDLTQLLARIPKKASNKDQDQHKAMTELDKECQNMFLAARRTIFIQPIYIFESGQHIGYFEVNMMNKHALQHISTFL